MSHLLDIGQLFVARPILLSRRSHDFEDLVNLVELAGTLEEHLLCQQLNHDAPQGPNVDGRRILLRAYSAKRNSAEHTLLKRFILIVKSTKVAQGEL